MKKLLKRLSQVVALAIVYVVLVGILSLPVILWEMHWERQRDRATNTHSGD